MGNGRDWNKRKKSQNGNRIGIMILAAILVLMVAVILVVGIWKVQEISNEKEYQEQIASALKYVSTDSYEQAVLAYQKAIEADPEKETAYVELAKVYIRGGSVSDAKVVLRKGYSRTSSQAIQLLLNSLVGKNGEEEADTQEEEEKQYLVLSAQEIEQASPDIGFNTSFLQKAEVYTYEDYEREFGKGTITGMDDEGFLMVQYEAAGLTCRYKNTADKEYLVNYNTQTVSPNAMPWSLLLDRVSLVFRNYEMAVGRERLQNMVGTLIQVQEQDNGSYIELPYGSDTIQIDTDAEGNIVEETTKCLISLPNANAETESEGGSLSGSVLDAVTGLGLGQAKIQCLGMAGEASGKAVQATADGNGVFEVELAAGSWKVEISKDGYVTEEFEATLAKGQKISGEQYVLSPNMEAGQIRIVLEWGSYPLDLDSYLDGTLASGTAVHTSYYDQKSANSSGDTIAELDVDDRDGYGPETTTLYDTRGTFRFHVEDFQQTGTMGTSGAVVKIYKDNQAPEIVEINSGCVNSWEVCEIVNGQVTILNQ